jgi:hypothetical protein
MHARRAIDALATMHVAHLLARCTQHKGTSHKMCPSQQRVSSLLEVSSRHVTSRHVFGRHLRRPRRRPEGGNTAWAIAGNCLPLTAILLRARQRYQSTCCVPLRYRRKHHNPPPWQTSSRGMVCSDTTRCRSSRLGPGTLSTSAIGAGRHLHTSYDAACISACWASAFVR